MQIKTKIKILLAISIVFCFSLDSSTVVKGLTEEQLNSEIDNLSSEIQDTRKKIKQIEDQKAKYLENIKLKQKESVNLQNQLDILENRVAKATIEMEEVELEMNKVNLEIQRVSIEIRNKEQDIIREKNHIANTLKFAYKESDVTTLEILLLNDSLADFLNNTKHLEDINKEMGDSIDFLKKVKKELEEDKLSLNQKNEELLNLKEDLKQKKLALEKEQNNKEFLLKVTKESEKEFQKLLSSAKEEQREASLEIVKIEKEIRNKIKALKDKEKLEFDEDGLAWPVPKNYVTTHFHDPDYPFRHLFEHPAIDIRAAQGTTLKAAASGYVARVKLKGTSYGYIMLIHGDGISTVYGHISKSYVKEEEYVMKGQTIGLTGGMPGTRGAGRLTTGPHLHFEVRKDGIPVDPLEYLD